ncbi:SPW repeat protein [Halorussus salilacus]|uniref:SPW repeat domain-containing protein n=1 Tax=Halorussus salilacus TaxID=2953750 RepID=UPI0020A01B0E|nr:SPW repeat protein [Halorussus salilacus]USZ67297.1 SPW repeat protein [Halorussus salilacus]
MSETTTTSDTRATDDNTGWISAVIALLGGWLVVSAFLFEPPAANFWNDIIVGAAIGIIAGYNAIRTDDYEPVSTGAASLVALLGLWMVVAPFVFEVVTDAALWSDVATGALVAALGAYNAYQSRSAPRRSATAEPEGR